MNEEAIERLKSVFSVEQVNVDESQNKAIISYNGVNIEFWPSQIREDGKSYYWLCVSDDYSVGFNFSDNVLYRKKTKMIRKTSEIIEKARLRISNNAKIRLAEKLTSQIESSNGFANYYGTVTECHVKEDESYNVHLIVHSEVSSYQTNKVVFTVLNNYPYLTLETVQTTNYYTPGAHKITQWLDIAPNTEESNAQSQTEHEEEDSDHEIEDEMNENEDEREDSTSSINGINEEFD